MRFFEFSGDDPTDKLVMVLRNYIGRSSSKNAPAKLNWSGLNQIFQTSGIELAADYETFKSIYDSNPTVQGMIKNFNADGVELNVPGVAEPGDANEPVPNGGADSAEVVGKIADSNAAKQLSQNQSGIKV